MGNVPSKPTGETLQELQTRKPQLCRGAAAAVARADVILVKVQRDMHRHTPGSVIH